MTTLNDIEDFERQEFAQNLLHLATKMSMFSLNIFDNHSRKQDGRKFSIIFLSFMFSAGCPRRFVGHVQSNDSPHLLETWCWRLQFPDIPYTGERSHQRNEMCGDRNETARQPKTEDFKSEIPLINYRFQIGEVTFENPISLQIAISFDEWIN